MNNIIVKNNVPKFEKSAQAAFLRSKASAISRRQREPRKQLPQAFGYTAKPRRDRPLAEKAKLHGHQSDPKISVIVTGPEGWVQERARVTHQAAQSS